MKDPMLLPAPRQLPPDLQGRSELLAGLLASPVPEPRRHTRRRTAVVAAGVLALAGGGATAYAVTRSGDVTHTTGVECDLRAPDALALVVNAVSGDPVDDCGRLWRQLIGGDPPALTAYDNGAGGIEVLAAGLPVPSGFTPLGPAVHQDGSGVELQASVQDPVDGLGGRCLDTTSARAFAQSELRRVGRPEIEIVVRTQADGQATCAMSYGLITSQAGKEQLLLAAAPPPDKVWPSATPEERDLIERQWPRLLTDLRAISAHCQALPSAVQVATAAAARFGHPVEVEQVVDPAASCTRVDLVEGGSEQVVLHGPA